MLFLSFYLFPLGNNLSGIEAVGKTLAEAKHLYTFQMLSASLLCNTYFLYTNIGTVQNTEIFKYTEQKDRGTNSIVTSNKILRNSYATIPTLYSVGQETHLRNVLPG